MMIPLQFVVIMFSLLLGAFFAIGFWKALTGMHPIKAIRNLLAALLMFLTTAVTALLMVAHGGYHLLTREETAATVCVEPLGKQRFRATVVMADGASAEYSCRGDQLYIDAHILKWHPWLNLLGIHATYELDRMGGRYADINDEKQLPRTVYGLSENKVLNLFDLRKKWEFLHPLLDAQYGSATFIDIEDNAVLDVRVSTTGLLIRKSETGNCSGRR
jgi:hypothetical protein